MRREVGVAPPAARVDEEADRRRAASDLDRRAASVRRGRAGPAAGPANSCSPERSQPRPAGDEHARRGQAGEQLRHQRRGRQDVLEVVERRAAAADPEDRRQGRERRPIAASRRTPRARAIVVATRAGSRTGARATNQTPVGERRRGLRGHAERQAGLADAARPGQRHQPDVRAAQQAAHHRRLGLPPDERRQRHREGRGRGTTAKRVRETFRAGAGASRADRRSRVGAVRRRRKDSRASGAIR